MQKNLVIDTYKIIENLEIRYFVKTDVGLVRVKNEDNFIVGPFLSSTTEWTVPTDSFQLDERGSVFIVADGMGGAVAGQIASIIAVESIKSFLINELVSKDSEVEIGQVLNEALKVANRDIIEYSDGHPECSGMGTTATICFIRNNRLFISWIGDSRVYRYSVNGRLTSNSYNEGNLEILTDDHSLVWNDVLNGMKSPEEARVAHNSNVITQSLGDVFSTIKPDHRIYDLFEGDLILNCSDGLNSMLSDKEIQNVFEENLDDTKKISEELVTKSLEAGGKDNITIILMKIIKGPLFISSDTQMTKEYSGSTRTSKPRNNAIAGQKSIKIQKIMNIVLLCFVLVATINIAWLEKESIGNFLNINLSPDFSNKQDEKEEKIEDEILDKEDNEDLEVKEDIPNAKDKVPNYSNDDNKDSDFDGVIDRKDKCPHTAGLLSLNGCPIDFNSIQESQELSAPQSNPSSNNTESSELNDSDDQDLQPNGSEDLIDSTDTNTTERPKTGNQNIDTVSSKKIDTINVEDSLGDSLGKAEDKLDDKIDETPNSKYEQITINEHPESAKFAKILERVTELLKSDKLNNTDAKIALSRQSKDLKDKIVILNQSYTLQNGKEKKLIREMNDNKKRIYKILKKYDLKV